MVASSTPRAGEQFVATVIANDQNGAPMTVGDPAWTSSAPNVASVSSSGVITTLSAGQATISASIFAVRGSVTLTVAPPAPGPAPVATVTVNPLNGTLEAGNSIALTAVTRDLAGSTLLDRSVAWSSSNADVATVSVDGVVTAIAEGSAIIEALSESKRGSFAINVTPAVDSLIVITVPYPYPQTTVGDTITAIAVVQSPYRIVSVTASMGGQPTPLSYGRIGSAAGIGTPMGWSAQMNLSTLPFGAYALVFTAIDEIGHRRVRAIPLVRNPTISGGTKTPTSNK